MSCLLCAPLCAACKLASCFSWAMGDEPEREMKEEKEGAKDTLIADDSSRNLPLYTRLRYASFLIVGFMLCIMVRGGMWGVMRHLPLSDGCEAPPEPPPPTPMPTNASTPPAKWWSQEAVAGAVKGAVDSVKGEVADAAAAAAAEAKKHAQDAAIHAAGLDGSGHGSVVVSSLCAGHAMVYRVSCALSCFYLVHMMLQCRECCCVDEGQKNTFQGGFFRIKTIIFVLFLIVSLWVPNDVFNMYAKLCVPGAGLWLVIQVVLLIDFVYDWNDSWARKAEDDQRWGVYLVLFTALFYIAGLAIVVMMYLWFTQGDECDLNGFFITLTLVVGLVYTGLSVRMPHGSIFVAGAVFAYTCALCFSAIKNGASNDGGCNALASQKTDGLTAPLLLSSAFVAGSVAWACASAGSSRGALSLSVADEDEDEETATGKNYMFFHLLLLLGSMYMAMLLTNWGDSDAAGLSIASGGTSMWVKIISEWCSIAAFLWSLIAPVWCCKDRDYGMDLS